MNDSINLFEGHIPYYKITKPVRLIELFAGIGSQHQALKNLGVKIDRSTIVEWQVNSIQAYNDIHIRKYDDHTQGLDKQELAKRLNQYGVSLDYNQPAKVETLLRKGDEWLRNVYNNVINTNNKVNIMSVKAKDLQILETDKYDYILTYSFPCQDLSKAGLRKGMTDKTTRSGLLWEVERIISECNELPQVLLMENVPDVIGSKFINDFQRWEERLRELGYTNYTEILNSKDFGIPQNRERAFMVSILGSSLYNFPQKQPLNIRLKHMLEKNVDEKFYLSNVAIERISKWKAQQNPFKDIEKEKLLSPTLTARGAGEDHSGMILVSEATTLDEHNGTIKQDGLIGTIVATQFKQGHGHSVVETKEFANYLTWEDSKGRINTQDHRAYFEDRLSGTIQAIERGIPNTLLNNLKIRKLTPKECYRLMGFGDEAYELAAPKQTTTSLYHQAGDSIVVNVLMGIFKELL